MPIQYNNQKLIPAPFVSIREEPHKTGDGRVIGTTYVITLTGKILAEKGGLYSGSGYPADTPLSHDEHLKSILVKQKAYRNLFKDEGKSLEIQPWDGSAPLKCNPRIREPFSVSEGIWYEYCDYSITFEADELTLNGVTLNSDSENYKVLDAQESWDIEILDENLGTYRLVRQVSAIGKRHFDSAGNLEQEAWENAKDYVLERIQLGLKPARMTAQDVLDEDSLQAFNYLRSQSIDETGGRFSVTESWLCFDPGEDAPAIEEWSVDIRESFERATVSVSGQILGLEVRNNTTRELVSTKWENAESKWSTVSSVLQSRAENLSGISLHASPVSYSVGKNQQTGTINYNYEYDDRPNAEIAGALSEVVSISLDNIADVFAEIPTLGRALGPVLQDIGTTTSRKKSVSMEVQMPRKSQSFTPTAPDTASYMLTFMPVASTVFVASDTETWEENSGRYTRNTSWVWEP